MQQNFQPILTDRIPLRLPKTSISEEGYITVSARIARAGIQTYYGHELIGVAGEIEPEKLYNVYRAEDEVFAEDTLQSFADVPITMGHPNQEVSAENYKSHAIGHIIGTPIRDGDFIRADLTIRDASAIAKIQAGEASQLSAGYHADVQLQNGVTPDGLSYDAVQTNIRGNHIALVDMARCGPTCRIADGFISSCTCTQCQSNKEHKMSEFVMLDGEQIPIAEAVEKLKEANARMAATLKESEATIEALMADVETQKGEVEALKQSPTQDADFSAKVKVRAQMLSDARQVLGSDTPLAELSDPEIRRKVINHVYGDSFATGASDHALMGMYKVAIRDALKSTDTLNGRVTAPISKTELKQAEARRKARLSSAWKQ